MRVAFISVMLIGAATGGLGCASEKVRVAQEYPVYWNVENAVDCGLYFRSEDPMSFASSVIQVKKGETSLRVNLTLWNKTGKDILILRNIAGLMRWKIVSLRDGRLSEYGRVLYPVTGYAGPYDLLGSTIGEEENFTKLDREKISFDIQLYGICDAEYSDIELLIQLEYYVPGCEVPACFVVSRSMRVIYVD